MSKKKEYFEFLEEVSERVEKNFFGKVKGEIVTSIRNNNVPVTGLMLKGEEGHVAPNFYLERQFVEWMSGIRTLDEIAAGLCKAYGEEIKKSNRFVSEIQFSWEEFRRKVFMHLINRDRNKELLEEVPYQEFMDLAVVYYYSVPISEEVTGTMIVTEEHLKLLEVSVEELHQAAESNCQRFHPVKFCGMEEIVRKLGMQLGVVLPESAQEYPLMYVLTNNKGMFGAVSMVFQEELKSFSERLGRGFYLLPSSVHEVILIPEYDTFCVEYFIHMVREINATQVDATEVLSDSVYYYDKGSCDLRRVG